MRRPTISFTAGLALLVAALWALPAVAQLTERHTDYGVSQYIATHLRGGRQVNQRKTLRLINPTPRGHVAAALVYEARYDVIGEGSLGLFVGCFVRNVPVNGSVTVGDDLLPATSSPVTDESAGIRRYAEIISVPRNDPRMIDGFGIFAYGGGRHEAQLLHPGMFQLPFDNVAAGQRQAATDCVCDALTAQSLPDNTFASFGIGCG